MKQIKTLHRIIQGSSTEANELGYNSIDLIVTSPPYGDVKDYDVDNECNIGNYKDDEYRRLMKGVYKECIRVLRPGRRLVINISDVPVMTEYGQAVGMYGQMTVDIINEIGGVVLNNIGIWTKGRCRAGADTVGTLPYPGSPVLLNNWEYIYIFKKFGDPHYPGDPDIRNASKVTTDELRDWLYLTWAIRTERDRRHIAPYPIEIPYRVIRLYSYVGETVYDPFLGSGTTMEAARMAGRSSVGYEIGYQLTDDAIKSLKSTANPTWLDLIKNKVSWGQQTLEPIGSEAKGGMVLTSPIIYRFIKDEDSLSSVAELVSTEDTDEETISPITIERASGLDVPVAEDTNAQICPQTNSYGSAGAEVGVSGGVMPDTLPRPLKTISVGSDIRPKRVDNLTLDNPYVSIQNGYLIWLRKDAGYPIFEVV